MLQWFQSLLSAMGTLFVLFKVCSSQILWVRLINYSVTRLELWPKMIFPSEHSQLVSLNLKEWQRKSFWIRSTITRGMTLSKLQETLSWCFSASTCATISSFSRIKMVTRSSTESHKKSKYFWTLLKLQRPMSCKIEAKIWLLCWTRETSQRDSLGSLRI